MYVIISGGGKVGEYLAHVMLDNGHQVAVIEQDRETADRLSVELSGRYLVIMGDGCDSKFQEDAGIRKADVFVAATGHDDTNLVSCEIARRVFQVPRCIARVNSPKNIRIFRKLEIEPVSSTTMIANFIEEETISGSMGIVASLSRENVSLIEVTVPRMRSHNSGIPLDEVDMPEGSRVIAVNTGEGTEIANEDTFLQPGDRVIVIAEKDVLAAARAAIREL